MLHQSSSKSLRYERHGAVHNKTSPYPPAPPSGTKRKEEEITCRIVSPHNRAKYRKVCFVVDASSSPLSSTSLFFSKLLQNEVAGRGATSAGNATRDRDRARLFSLDPDAMQAFLEAASAPISAVYCFAVVNESIHDVGQDGDCVLLKYGITVDLRRRAKDHVRTYGKDIFLVCYAAVDPTRLREAEGHVRDFFRNSRWHVEGHPRFRELAVVPTARVLDTLIPEYQHVHRVFSQDLSSVKLELEVAQRMLRFYEGLFHRAFGGAIELDSSQASKTTTL